MRFQLLGPLSITDGRDVAVLPPSKPTALLAALLVRPGAIVSTDRLRGAVWGEEQPTTAKAALQSCVLRLRRLFAKYGIEDQAVVAVAGGYRIDADADTLDLLHFRRLVERAAGAGADSELYALRSALALWQGPLLANVPSELLHRDEVPRLAEERLRVLERVVDIELEHGRCREALVDLWEVTRVYPEHERFAEQLMTALYRLGRQTEALAEYRRVKEHLRDRLGVDPRAELQVLELAILRGERLDPVDTGRRPAATAALAGPAEDAHRAPHAEPFTTTAARPRPEGSGPAPHAPAAAALPTVPGFTGRAGEVDALVRLLTGGPGDGGHAPVAVLSGAPGIGKTALALHVARLVAGHHPGGSALVQLTHADGTPRTAEDAAAELRRVLPGGAGAGPVLLVLDDVVHPDQVRPLLTGHAGAAALVTSRTGLAALVATHGGTVHRLGALAPEEAEAFLVSALGGERTGAEPAAARHLADACGHHPLALRIAAARLLTRPRLRLTDYADWLRQDPAGRLSLADDPRTSVPQRLDEALGRLSPALAEAHLRLAASPYEPLTAARAAGVLGVPAETAELILEGLLDAGFLEEGLPGDFRPHALLRAHARRAAGSPGGRSQALPRPPLPAALR
ncbi:BTAD domain-containing putative transcriptional regulator [Streptomyces hydrogenans]|uniref:BTAD domain-containing putative transcriptional regulator n=1 Tax=Streptomyces hydrogenans TaxID=1873719 RepID=UPI00278BB3B0|nr:BTAD domain-containing putative transcriptional regulator [Streptomyces hydrogenans]